MIVELMLAVQYKINTKTKLWDNACILVWCKNFEITEVTSIKIKMMNFILWKKLQILVLLKRNPILLHGTFSYYMTTLILTLKRACCLFCWPTNNWIFEDCGGTRSTVCIIFSYNFKQSTYKVTWLPDRVTASLCHLSSASLYRNVEM